MKKKVMLGVIAAMVVSMSATVFAAPSIGQIIPEESADYFIPLFMMNAKLSSAGTIDGTDEKALDSYTSKIEACKDAF